MEMTSSTAVRYLIVLSARTEERLFVCARRHLDFLEQGGDGAPIALRDLAFTLQAGRVAQEYRVAFLAGSVEEAITRLRLLLGLAPVDDAVNILRSGSGGAATADALSASQLSEHDRHLLQIGAA